jgi:hypothetical protein
LAGRSSAELDILVEDEVSRSLINHAVGREERTRTTIVPVGSAAAVIRCMAARRKDNSAREAVAILDGDMISNKERYIDLFVKALEQLENPEEEKDWLISRLAFLPGNAWPERWVVSTLLNGDLGAASAEFGMSEDELKSMMAETLLEDRHAEYPHAASRLSLELAYARERLTYHATLLAPDESERLRQFVRDALGRVSA